MRKMYWLVICTLLILAGTAFAENDDTLKKIIETAVSPLETVVGKATELDKIVVSPSRVEEKMGSASCSISTISREDFERKKIETVKDALTDQVGVDIRQAGAFQGDASLLMRGGNSNQTLILVDGVKVYDPISPNGAYNIAYLTLDNVEQIEVLRGPQSALYGSDAMSGVVSINSKKAEDTYVNATWEAGSFYTYTEEFEAGSVAHGFHYSLAGSRMDTKGISQAQAKHNNEERDPYDRTSFSARVDYDIGDKALIGSTFRHTKAHFAFDQGADADDDNAFAIYREDLVTLYANQKILDWWEHSTRMGWMETMRQYFDDDSPGFDFDRSKYFGKYFKFNYENRFEILNFDNIVAGYDYTNESAEFHSQNDYSGFMTEDIMPEVGSNENALYLENRLNLQDRLTSTIGMRVSRHSRAGTSFTYRLDGAYLFATGTKVRGLVATGFKAPSLYQLFAPSNAYFGGGNPNLQAEQSSSYEYGLDQYAFGDKVSAGITYFYTLYTNLIDALTDPNTLTTDRYINIGKAQVHGIEAAFKIKPAESVMIRFGLTYQKTKDFQNDQDLIRRPERKFFMECFWQATKKMSFDVMLRYNGPMSDNTSNPLWALNTYKVKEFTVVSGVMNYDISDHFSVYVKTENLFNKYYEEVRGFTTPPFSLYGGVKARF